MEFRVKRIVTMIMVTIVLLMMPGTAIASPTTHSQPMIIAQADDSVNGAANNDSPSRLDLLLAAGKIAALSPVSPISGIAAVGQSVAKVGKAIWKSTVGKFTEAVIEGNTQMFSSMATMWVELDFAPNSGNENIAGIRNIVVMLTVAALMISLIVGGVRIAVSRSKGLDEGFSDLGAVLMRMFVATSLVPVLTISGMTLSDSLAKEILRQFGPSDAGIVSLLVKAGGAELIFGPVVMLVVTIVCLLGSMMQFVALAVRFLVVPIAAGLAPLFAAGSMTGIGKNGLNHLYGYIAAAVVYKPVAALLYVMVWWWQNSLLSPDSGGSDNYAASMKLLTLTMLGLVGFSGPSLVKIIAPVAAPSAGASGAAGAGAVGAAAGLASGAVKVGAAAISGGTSAAVSGAGKTASSAASKGASGAVSTSANGSNATRHAAGSSASGSSQAKGATTQTTSNSGSMSQQHSAASEGATTQTTSNSGSMSQQHSAASEGATTQTTSAGETSNGAANPSLSSNNGAAQTPMSSTSAPMSSTSESGANPNTAYQNSGSGVSSGSRASLESMDSNKHASDSNGAASPGTSQASSFTPSHASSDSGTQSSASMDIGETQEIPIVTAPVRAASGNAASGSASASGSNRSVQPASPVGKSSKSSQRPSRLQSGAQKLQSRAEKFSKASNWAAGLGQQLGNPLEVQSSQPVYFGQIER